MEDKKLNWWQLMYQNNYLQLFGLAILFLTGCIVEYNTFTLSGFIILISIPVIMMIVIAYKGFFQFWRDYSNSK